MLTGIVADAELFAEHQRRDFSAQFLARIAFRAERVPQVPRQAGRVAGRVPELVQRRCIIAVTARKLAALGQGDRVLGQPVESPIAAHMADRNPEALVRIVSARSWRSHSGSTGRTGAGGRPSICSALNTTADQTRGRS